MQKKLIILISVVALVGIMGFLLLAGKNVSPEKQTPAEKVAVSFRQFLPLGGEKTPTENNVPPGSENENPAVTPSTPTDMASLPLLRQVSTLPIAGAISFLDTREIPTLPTMAVETPTDASSTATSLPKTEQVLAVRYVESTTGYIYQKFIDETKEARITSTVIPEVYESDFFNKDSLIYRYLGSDNSIKTYYASIQSAPSDGTPQSSAPSELKGMFYHDNIPWLSVSQLSGKVFYFEPLPDGTVNALMSLPDGSKKTLLWNSAFTQWIPSWVGQKNIGLLTASSAQAPGFLYALDTEKKSISRVLGDIVGLDASISPDTKNVLYSKPQNTSMETGMFERASGTNFTLGINTLPEKCVWTKDSTEVYCGVPNFIESGQYPDKWYRGETSFDDTFWKIDTASKYASKIFDPESGVDAENLFLSPDETYLFFTNKKDKTLWVLDLAPEKHASPTPPQ